MLTLADECRWFETECGRLAYVHHGPNWDKKYNCFLVWLVWVDGIDTSDVRSDGESMTGLFKLARRLPHSDPRIPEGWVHAPPYEPPGRAIRWADNVLNAMIWYRYQLLVIFYTGFLVWLFYTVHGP